MAEKTDDTGPGDTNVIFELKKELVKAVDEITADKDCSCSLDAIDRGMRNLSALRNLRLNQEDSQKRVLVPPQEFMCPLSGKFMVDPVVIASGYTYDQSSIQKWLNDGNLTCPQSKQVLPHTNITPNNLVREMIVRWCEEHDFEMFFPATSEDTAICEDKQHLVMLLEKLSSASLTDQQVIATEIRMCSKKSPGFRANFGEMSNAISQLLKPYSQGMDNVSPDLHENLIATILNLSIHDKNKKLIAADPYAIPLLIESLSFGSIDARCNAAAALFSLSSFDSNKNLIGQLGALKPLIDLLEVGNPSAMKDAASAIFSLCIVVENQARAMSEGAVKVIMQKVLDNVLVDELITILALLSCHQEAIEEMAELGALPFLLTIIKESDNEKTKENCISILYTMCWSDRQKLRFIRREEDGSKSISRLAETGTSRAQRKANALLCRIRKYAYSGNTA